MILRCYLYEVEKKDLENNAVVYFSHTGHSLETATYLAGRLSWPILTLKEAVGRHFEHLLFVAPIHRGKFPSPVYSFFKRSKVEEAIIVAVHGRIHHGDAIFELQRKFRLPIVGAAYFPTAHAYLPDDHFTPPYGKLDPLLPTFGSGRYFVVPREEGRAKHPHCLPKVNIRLRPGCRACHSCEAVCAYKGIRNGKINPGRCTGCLACLSACPDGLLRLEVTSSLVFYLKTHQSLNEPEIYIGG